MSRSELHAVLIMSLGMMFIPLGDTAGKTLVAAGISPLFVAWSRFVFGVVALLPVSQPARIFRLMRDWRIWLRGFFLAAGISCILNALKTEPLANVFGAFFVGPIFSYALSVWLLKETVTTARTALLALGFLGVLLVVQPSAGMGFGLLWAVAAGLFYGAFLTSSRWLADTAPPRTLLLSQMLVGTILLLPLALPGIPPMEARTLWLLLFSGAASMTGNLLLIVAYGRAGASVLAPFVYMQLLSAALFGWLIFGDIPGPLASAGLLLLFGSGVATLALRRR